MALLLCVGTTWLLGATAVMGFTRDESFYFKYAEVYQGWFQREASGHGEEAVVQGAGDRAEDKRDTLATWRENFEHPPLMKVLFGWSWRLFAWKARPLEVLPGERGVRVSGLDDATGFAVGDEVTLHPPIPVTAWHDHELGVPVPPPPPEAIGRAVVLTRDPHSATLDVQGDLDALRSRCASGDSLRVTGCSARTSGLLQRLPEHQAMRLPTWVFTGLLIGLLYLFGTELFGRRAGLFAALAFLLVPRHFYHAHLCTFDMPVTTVIVATVYAYWRSLRSRLWVAVTALLWGVSLLTKLNGYFIPIPLLASWLGPWVLRGGARTLRAAPGILRVRAAPVWLNRPTGLSARAKLVLAVGAGATLCMLLVGMALGKVAGLAAGLVVLSALRPQLALPPMPKAFVWMLVVGLPMQFWLWPQMTYDTAQNFGSYVSFHVTHVHYPQEYFGDLLNVPPFPWTYPLVMTALTVPSPLLLVMLLGSVLLLGPLRRERSLEERILLFTNALMPIALIALPGTPIFGGVKHWMATLAFSALIGGLGFEWLCRATVDRLPRLRAVFAGALLSLTVASGAVASVHSAPFGTAYYNELIGGTRGAADARMMRKYWGYAAGYVLDVVNQRAPRYATVAFHEATWDAFEWYQRLGWLRSDLRWKRNASEPCRPGDLMLFHHQGPMAEDEIATRRIFDTVAPVSELRLDGVPIISVYACREPEGAAASEPSAP